MAKPVTASICEIPERAIQAFETWSALRVCAHDIEMEWARFLPGRRLGHNQHPFCQAAKQKGYVAACRHFELKALRPYLKANPEGCAKICHAGLLEWSAAVLHAGQPSLVLFAGLRRPAQGFTPDLRDSQQTRASRLWPNDLPKPARATPEQSVLYREGLCQLAARLQLWIETYRRARKDKNDASGEEDQNVRRQIAIQGYIADHCLDPDVTIGDLARALHLSKSRTGHLVKEVCGQTFIEELRLHRLRHAAKLLWMTNQSVAEVAMACGFGDLSNFHRCFRRQYGLSPLQYRKHGSRY